MYRSFEELEVWKRGCNLAVDVYFALKDCREFMLRDQMNSAAVSIPSNIAEGAEKIGILAPTTTRPLIAETKEIASMLQGLINSKKP